VPDTITQCPTCLATGFVCHHCDKPQVECKCSEYDPVLCTECRGVCVVAKEEED